MSKKHEINKLENPGTHDNWVEEIKKLKKAEIAKIVAQLIPNSSKEKLANQWWPIDFREEFELDIPVSIFIKDPSRIKDNSGLTQIIKLSWEQGIQKGPTSSRIAVVDYDGDKNELSDSATWSKEKWCFTGPNNKNLNLNKKENYQFHQVNAWAVVSSVLALFQDNKAMGRLIPWGFEGNRLIVVPHAGYGKNAFYDRRSKSLQFYYFDTNKKRFYTCLSHDIVAHETGHAILDGIRPYYNEISSHQTSAFHEFIADLSAILISMRNNDMRHVLEETTKGDLKRDEYISHLASEFGKLVTNREFLRSALNPDKMEQVNVNNSPHKNSQVLTGAIFDIMTELVADYITRREKSSKQALWYAIGRFTRMILQPLDYCPPVDIQFEDYANAILVRDKLADPRDPNNYRPLIHKVFKDRQIPYNDDEKEPDYSNFHCSNIMGVLTSETEAYEYLHARRKKLYIPEEQDIHVLKPYQTRKVRRLNKRLPTEIVLQYVWREDVVLEGDRFGPVEEKKVELLCGGTLVFDDEGNLLHWCRKPGTQFKIPGKRESDIIKVRDELQTGQKRINQLLDYISILIRQGAIGLTAPRETGSIHRWSQVEALENAGNLRLEMSPRLHIFEPEKIEENVK